MNIKKIFEMGKDEEADIRRNEKTNDVIVNKYPALVDKIMSNKKGVRFVQIEDVIKHCSDKTHIEKALKGFYVQLQLKQEQMQKTLKEIENVFENFLNDIETAGEEDEKGDA